MLSAALIMQFVWIQFCGVGRYFLPMGPNGNVTHHEPFMYRYMLSCYCSPAAGILIAYLVSTTPVTNIGGRAQTIDPLLRALLTAHIKASQFLIFLLVVHIAGALWLVRRDGVWEAMLRQQMIKPKAFNANVE